MNNLASLLNSVHEGSALEILANLPDNCVDITVTSPPYNKQRNTYGWLVQTNRYSHYNDHLPEEDYQNWQVKVLNELYRVTKPGGSVFYNHKVRWVDGNLLHPLVWVMRSDWRLRQEIIWDRAIAANMRGWRFWQVDERIYWLFRPIGDNLVGPELESRHAKMTSIWRFRPVPRSDDHPAPFPIELPIRAVYSLYGEERRLVLDPFCGIGTTLVAARLLGHDYIGVDIAPDYVEHARRRLENSEDERVRAQAEIDKHVVNDPFRNRKERGTVTWPFAPQHVKNRNAGEMDGEAVSVAESNSTD